MSLAVPAATASACGTASTERAPDAGGRDAAAPDATDAQALDEAQACAPVRVEAGLLGEDGACGRFVRLPCGIPAELRGTGCYPSPDLCATMCPTGAFFICAIPAPSCQEDGGLAPDAAVYLDCTTCLGNVGRRPVGLLPPARSRRRARSPVGQYFAQLAYMEAASVDAFHQLRARLQAFGAPAWLKRAASRAAADEARHARVTLGLARRHGASLRLPETPAPARLTFQELALENAVEGCVRETFAVLIALHQAERAEDPRVAGAMTRIAADETRHAELAWAIHRWALPRLSVAVRRRIRAAQANALAELRATAGVWPEEVTRVAGVPDCLTEQRLVEAFGRSILGVGASGSAVRCPGDRASRRAAS